MATHPTPYGPVEDGFELSVRERWAQEDLVPLTRRMYSVAGKLLELSPQARVYQAVTNDATPLTAIENGRKALRDSADFIYSLMPETVIEGRQIQDKALGISPFVFLGIDLLLQGSMMYAWFKFDDVTEWFKQVEGQELNNLAQALMPATLALQQANGDEKLAAEILAKGMEPPVFVKVDAVDYRPVLVLGGAALALGLLIYVQTR